MTRRQRLYGGVAITAVLLMIGAIIANRWIGVPAVVAVAAMWGWAIYRQTVWLNTIAFVLLLLLTAILLFLGVGAIWGILAATTAVGTWNLVHFYDQLAQAPYTVGERQMVTLYHRRLLLVAVASAAIAIMATTVRLQFGFTVALTLSLLAILGFSGAIAFLRRESD